MTYLRRALLALVLSFGLAPAFAQVPAAVPALPDTERRTSYSISGTTCACSVGFALFGDSTDYQNWVEVFINGVRYDFNDATHGWTITSPSGSLGTLARPITNAVLTFNAVQTGTVQIVGARRPRRASQFNENTGVSARNLNQVLTDIISQNREIWDKTNDMTGRGLFGLPGETIGSLPSATARAGALLAFDGSGNPVATTPGAGTGNVVGPGLSVNNDVACWNGTTGALLKDCGAIGTTTLTGDITGGPSVGTVATVLATVNANVGTWGSTTQLPTLTVDGKGRITAASNITITPANIGAVPTTRQILGGAGLTAGGALSADVTLSMATIANNTILANNSGIAAAPGNLSASQVLDMLGSTQGQVLYRSASGWTVLSPGSNGQLLTSGGPAANPSWTTASGTGTVTSVGAGTGITAAPSPIVGAGTISLTVPVTAPLGGTGVVSPATHTIPINQGASAQANTGTGTTGQCIVSNGASADPSFQSGCRTLLNTLPASGSVSLADTTSLTSTYKNYELVFENLLPTTTSATCTLKVNVGGVQSATYVANFTHSIGGTTSGAAVTTSFQICGVTTQSSSGGGFSGFIRVSNPASTTVPKVWVGQFNENSATQSGSVLASGYWNGSNAAVTGFEFTFSTGTIASGTIRVYGWN